MRQEILNRRLDKFGRIKDRNQRRHAIWERAATAADMIARNPELEDEVEVPPAKKPAKKKTCVRYPDTA